MSLQDMIMSVRERVERGEIDTHQGNIETSHILAQARKDLVDATQSVLARVNGESDTRVRQQPLVSTPVNPLRDETVTVPAPRIDGVTIDEFIMKWATVLRDALDGFITERSKYSNTKR